MSVVKPRKKRTASRSRTAAEKSRRPKSGDSGYEARKERERSRQAAASKTGRDIGSIPAVTDPKRRAKAEASLQVFCETYLADRFTLAWSDDHLEQLAEIERVIRDGGLQAIAAPRGDGKTTRLEAGVLWGVLTGHHAYAVLLTATAAHAPKRMQSLKQALLRNDLLLADWPEVCFPIRAMGGIANRCAGQLCDGHPTVMVWGKRQIVLPTIPGSKCSSAILECAGLLEATRGLNYALADGGLARPTVALIDDPQTNRSARSTVQSEEREAAIAAGIIHLPGPDQVISALLSCTVIQPGDMADRMLDRAAHPEWHGVRKQLMDAMPTDTALWDQYAEMYREGLAAGDNGQTATKFYRRNRKAMDAGAQPAWKYRKAPGELSATEHAMRLLIRDRASFYSEMQNAPEVDTAAAADVTITADQVAVRVSGYERYHVPPAAERLTLFIDVHKEMLYYVVCAWASGLTGWVIDYGTWPEQQATYFNLAHARQKISTSPAITATSLEGRITQALDTLLHQLGTREWKRMDGAEVSIELGLIDANWGESTNAVYDVCRQAQRRHGLRMMPSHGVPFGPAKRPIDRWDRKHVRGLIGEHWHVPPPGRGRAIRHVLIDAGRRKSALWRRLVTPAGDPGSLVLWAAPPNRHRLFAEHLTAETPVAVSGPYGDLVLWTLTPGRDNHWLDCLSGCLTAESMLGGKLRATVAAGTAAAAPAAAPKPKPKPKAVRYLDV